MGLDKDDTIVKRRMAQKMQFLAEDVAAAREPTNAELKDWYEKNRDKFQQPPRVSFRHLYFSPDRRGARARDDAASALAQARRAARGLEARGLARRSFHVPGVLPRARPGISGQGVRAALRARRPEASARLVAGTRRIRLRLASRLRRHARPRPHPALRGDRSRREDARGSPSRRPPPWEKAYKDMRAKYTVLLPAPPDAQTSARVAAPPRRKEIPSSSGEGPR